MNSCQMCSIYSLHTLADWFCSTPVASVQTLSPCISHQLEAFFTVVVGGGSRLVTGQFYIAI